MTRRTGARTPGLFAALSVIVAMQVRSLLKRKRLIFLVILLLLPPFVTLMMKLHSRNALDDWLPFAPQAYLVFLLPILSLFHGASAVADEVDDRTLGYLLMRPIPRDVLVFGKVIGAAMVTAVLSAFSFSLSHQIIYWAGSPATFYEGELGWQLFGIIGLIAWASLLYTTFAALLSLVVKWPTLAAIVYVVIIEIGCCYVPGPLARVAMTTQFMQLLPEVFPRAETMVAIGAGQEPPSADPLHAAGLLLLITGLLTVTLLRRFRNFDLSGSAEGDQ